MDAQGVQGSVLALIENAVMPLHEVLNAVRMVKKEAVEKINPLIITQASSLSSLPMDTSSVDFVVSMGRSRDFPGDKLLEEFSRVLKPGGEVFIHQTLDAVKENTTSSLERKLLVAGFSDIEVVRMAEVLPEGLQSFGVKGKKPSWKIGSSFSLKKMVKILPKVQVDDEMDLIDEDSLLSEEDLKKPQLPPVGDCEVGSTRKACKNCVCGRAEQEEKVQKLGVTVDQLENPQSACGSMWRSLFFNFRAPLMFHSRSSSITPLFHASPTPVCRLLRRSPPLPRLSYAGELPSFFSFHAASLDAIAAPPPLRSPPRSLSISPRHQPYKALWNEP